MLSYTTVEKLREMKMGVMAAQFNEQLATADAQALSFEERFGLLVDAEWANRKSNRLTRLIKSAGFSYPDASVEDIEYHSDRGLDKAFMMRLSTCAYIKEFRNIILLGATGSGKTYLSNALGIKACREFLTVKYIRLPELLGELAIARAEGNYRKVLKAYKNVHLLILDEWLLFPLKESESLDLLEIAEARYKKGSTIFCSQFEIAGWHQKLGDTAMADSVCDRIVHDSYTIIVKGNDSMRKRKGLNEAK
jgi:DNA replication protein DnaC